MPREGEEWGEIALQEGTGINYTTGPAPFR